LGIGDWGLGPIPNPQSPIPNPQSPFPQQLINIHLKIFNLIFFINIFPLKICDLIFSKLNVLF
jgi:hypothetical protein